MGTFSVWHIVIFAVIALLLFGGRGKVSDLMGDVAKGIKSFKKGMSDDDDDDDGNNKPRVLPPENRNDKDAVR